MADKYSTIQQHQPIRVPETFTKQERAMVIQLDEIFDDIYRRFGRLRIEDMGSAFRKRMEDDEGNISQLIVDVGNIEISVAGKYDKVSGITINSSGISISGSKYLQINSGCEMDIESGGYIKLRSGGILQIASGGGIDIKTGSTFTVQSGNFGIDAQGNAIFKGTVKADSTIACNISAEKITSGTMSANRISGGTLTLGGSNNANGTLIIKDASGTQIGKWDKDGISASSGTFSGQLSSPTGTIGGFSIYSDRLESGGFKIYPGYGSIRSGNWYLNSYGISLERTKSGVGTIEYAIGEYSLSTVSNRTKVSLTFDTVTTVHNNYFSGCAYFSVQQADNSFQRLKIYTLKEGSGYGEQIGIIASKITSGGVASNVKGMLGIDDNYWDINGDRIKYTTLIQNSSREIKHDIQTLPSLGERLDRLQPVTFVYDSDENETQRMGLIYEDTMEIMPEICTGDESDKAINYVELIPALLKEIQDLRGRVAELEGRT